MRPTDQISDPSWQDILDRDKEIKKLQERVAFAELDRDEKLAQAEATLQKAKEKAKRTGAAISRVVTLGRRYAEGKLSILDVASEALAIAQDLGAPIPKDGVKLTPGTRREDPDVPR